MTEQGRRAWRVPAILLGIVLIGVAALYERRSTPPSPPVLLEEAVTDLVPAVAPVSSPSSTWYCAAGTAWGSTAARPVPTSTTTSTARQRTTTTKASSTTTGTEGGGTTVPIRPLPPAAPVVAEQTVTLTNAADRPVRTTLRVVPSEGEAVTAEHDVPAHSRVDVTVSDLVKAPYASVLVESDGGGLGVEHRVVGPAGTAIAPCLSRTSAQWFFPAGSTRLGSRLVYLVFNPFPDDAVLDLSFETSEGTRTPNDFQGLVVPAGRVEAIDVTDVVTVRDQVATTMRARAGRVAAEQLQIVEGRDDPKGMTLVPGVPGAAPVWGFPGGPQLTEGVDVRYVVFNPGSTEADVALEIRSDAPGPSGQVSPYELRVRGGQYAEVSLRQDPRVPEGYGHWAVVRSRNGVPVVAQRVVRATSPAAPTGWTSNTGSPVTSDRWLAPVAGLDSGLAGGIEIANPGTLPATVTVRAERDGEVRAVASFDGVSLAPGARTVVDLSTLTAGSQLSLTVEADQPLLVESVFAFTGDPQGRSSSLALPWRDRQQTPDATLFAVQPSTTLPAGVGGAPSVPLPGTGDDTTPLGPDGATSVPGTGADGTAPEGTAPDGTTPEGTVPVGPTPDAGGAPASVTGTTATP